MVLGIDFGMSRVRLLSDDQTIAARTGGKISIFRSSGACSDGKRRVTLPDANECVLRTINLRSRIPAVFPRGDVAPVGRRQINRMRSGALIAGQLTSLE